MNNEKLNEIVVKGLGESFISKLDIKLNKSDNRRSSIYSCISESKSSSLTLDNYKLKNTINTIIIASGEAGLAKKITNGASNIKNIISDLIQKFIKFMKNVYSKVINALFGFNKKVIKKEKEDLKKEILLLEHKEKEYTVSVPADFKVNIKKLTSALVKIVHRLNTIEEILDEKDKLNPLELYNRYNGILEGILTNFKELENSDVLKLNSNIIKTEVITATYSELLEINSEIEKLDNKIYDMGGKLQDNSKFFTENMSGKMDETLLDKLSDERKAEFIKVFEEFTTYMKKIPDLYKSLTNYESLIIKELRQSVSKYVNKIREERRKEQKEKEESSQGV